MSTRRSKARSMMRSLTPCRWPWIAHVGHLFPILEGGTLIVTPEFGTRVEGGKIDQRFGVSPRLPVRGAACQVLRDMEPERHRELLLDGGDIEVRRGRDPFLRQRDAIVDRLHGARAEDLAGHELGRHDRGRELLNRGCPSGPSLNSSSGMNTGTSLASARRKSVCIASISGSGLHRGSDDSTSVAPSQSPRIVLISLAAAVMIGSSAFDPGAHTMDSRMIPRRMPASAPGVPGICAWLAYGVRNTDERGTVVKGSRGS